MKSEAHHFGFFWTPSAKATCLQVLGRQFGHQLKIWAFAKKGNCIQILDKTL